VSVSIPVLLVNPGRVECDGVGGFTGVTGGYRKVYRELYDYVRMLGFQLRKTPEEIQRSVWMNKSFGEILSLSVIRKILSPAESYLKKDAQGNRVPLPTRQELIDAGLESVRPSKDYLVRSVRDIQTFRDIIDRMGFTEKVLDGTITDADLARTLPNIWPVDTPLATKLADLRAMLSGSDEGPAPEVVPAKRPRLTYKKKSTAMTRQKQPTTPTEGETGMTTESMVAEVMANPAIAEIAMNPGYAFPASLADTVLGFFKSKGVQPSRARAGLKQLLRRMFGQKGARWSMNRREISGALDRVFPGRPKRALPPNFKPFQKGDSRLAQYRAAFGAKRKQTAGMGTIANLRQFLGMPDRGRRLNAAQERIEKRYSMVPSAKKPKVAKTRIVREYMPAMAAPVMGEAVGYWPRKHSYKKNPYRRNPAYSGGFINGMVETAIEGGGTALVGALTLKGVSWVDKNLVTKVIKPGADGNTNPWARLAASVVVGSIAGTAIRKAMSRTEIARKYNVGEIVGNGIAVGAMLYAFGGFEHKMNPFSGIQQSISGRVGSYRTAEGPFPVGRTVEIDTTSEMPLLSAGVNAYTKRGMDEGHMAVAIGGSVGVQDGIPLTA